MRGVQIGVQLGVQLAQESLFKMESLFTIAMLMDCL